MSLTSLKEALQSRLGKRYVLDSPAELSVYESDACTLIRHRPELVALPASTAEVAFIVAQCNAHHIPFTARGAGTGLSGGALPAAGGVQISLNRMTRIVEVSIAEQTATVEAGVVNARLNEVVGIRNLFYAPDPSSQSACTIGGNIAENAGGIHCIKHGVTSDHVLALEVVLPNGEVTWTGSANRRSHGPSLISLLVGSEGTLGIVTQAKVRLLPKAQATKVFLAAFPTVHDSARAVSAIIKEGLLPSALEFMDAFTVRAVNAAFAVGFPENAEAVLLIELDGLPDQIAYDETRLLKILETHHHSQLRTGTTATERQALWKARKGTVAAYGRYMPAFYLHDCVIPRSQLVTILEKIATSAEKYDVKIGNVFHAGDGNLHPNVLFDPKDSEMVTRALAAGEEILKACLAMGGTLSGEHGIGLEKQDYMRLQFSEASLERMRQLKACFDPQGLANPDKIFPHRAGCGEHRGHSPGTHRPNVTPPSLSLPQNGQENGVWI